MCMVVGAPNNNNSNNHPSNIPSWNTPFPIAGGHSYNLPAGAREQSQTNA